MSWITDSAVDITCLLAGAGICYGLIRWRDHHHRRALNLEEKAILEDARRNAEHLLREARLKSSEEALQVRQQAESSLASRQQQLNELETRLVQRECLINSQMERLLSQEKEVHQAAQKLRQDHEDLESSRAELECLKQRSREELQALAHLTETEARSLLMKEMEQKAFQDAAAITRTRIEEARQHAEEKARRILSIAIQRYASDYVFEHTTATVTLPNEEIKGRIIGKEGRNIRAFEAATGITVLIDDTPNAVVLSGFDPVRRETAREAMHRLVQDGRIHPARIEEVVQKVSQEMDESIFRAGEEASARAGVCGLAAPIVQLLGKLRFRLSFTQNVLDHSVEVAQLAALMAGEMGLSVPAAKRAGLLHDIGKAVDQEMEGPHAIVGAELLRRYGESNEIVNAVASHHDEVPSDGPLGILIGAADAISASRPGARSETMAVYIKRVEELERLACSFAGVEKSFALHAGRELRVFVSPDTLNDSECQVLARNLARRIEDEIQYPGQIRITVMRETRCIEYAK